MASFLVPVWMVYTILIFVLILLGVIGLLIWKYISVFRSDKILMITKDNRFRLWHKNVGNIKEVTIGSSKYFLTDKSAVLNNKGKALYLFQEGQATPVKLEYKNVGGLSSDTIMSIVNNKLVQLMLKVKGAGDPLIMIGAIGGLVAGVASVIILLIQLGVFGK